MSAAELAESTEQWTSQASAALAQGDLPRVRECLSAASELSPENGNLVMALGHAELGDGNLEAALAAYWKATLLMPKHAPAFSCHALVARLLGRRIEASGSAVRAISLDPMEPVALKVLARIHLDNKQPEAARQACDLVLQNHPEDDVARQMLNEVQVQEAKLAENISNTQFIMAPVPPRSRAVPSK